MSQAELEDCTSSGYPRLGGRGRDQCTKMAQLYEYEPGRPEASSRFSDYIWQSAMCTPSAAAASHSRQGLRVRSREVLECQVREQVFVSKSDL
jgi:hypothetical protein